jgi:hypothetical protein
MPIGTRRSGRSQSFAESTVSTRPAGDVPAVEQLADDADRFDKTLLPDVRARHRCRRMCSFSDSPEPRPR